MPVTVCTGASALRQRQFLASRFHIDMIVCSHDPREPNMSTHTAINECLLIATRASRSARAATIFVNLRRFPKTVEAVQDVVAAIRSRRIDEVGSVCEWPEDLVRAGDWSPVQWFDPELAQAARTVRELPGMSSLRAVFEIGPPGQSVRDEFERVAGGSTGSEGIPVFDSMSGALRTSLEGEPDAFWRVRPDSRRRRRAKSGLVESHLRRAGWVLLALRARTNNAAVVALCHREKSLGNGFVPVVTGTVRQAKSLCVLWNSTPALLQLLNLRTRMLMYPNWSIAQLGAVKVPESLRVPQVEAALVETYDRSCNARLQPWAQADTDPVRREIDEAVAEAYGISAGVLSDWRERLAKEPTVGNRSPL